MGGPLGAGARREDTSQGPRPPGASACALSGEAGWNGYHPQHLSSPLQPAPSLSATLIPAPSLSATLIHPLSAFTTIADRALRNAAVSFFTMCLHFAIR